MARMKRGKGQFNFGGHKNFEGNMGVGTKSKEAVERIFLKGNI